MDKKLKKNMKALFDLIVDEAEKNEEFAEALTMKLLKKRPRIIQERKELLIEETRQFSILLSWQKMVS